MNPIINSHTNTIIVFVGKLLGKIFPAGANEIKANDEYFQEYFVKNNFKETFNIKGSKIILKCGIHI